jgi:hypothetical protein
MPFGRGETMTADHGTPRLYERDIDFIVREELLFNEHVRTLFRYKLELPDAITVESCLLSVSDNTGETDIEVRFACGELRGMMLIENKIDAAFQPNQPERYQERATMLRNETGGIVHCVLIAPAGYIKPAEVSPFDTVVTYEEFAIAIASENTDRSKHRAKLIEHAIDLARRSYLPVEPAEVTALWFRIYNIASNSYPELKMQAPGAKGRWSSWITFKADLPRNISVDWKITKAVVDLSFWDAAQHRPNAAVDLSVLGAAIGKAGNQTVIRLPLSNPPPKWIELDDSQIHEALTAAWNVLGFYNDNRASFSG